MYPGFEAMLAAEGVQACLPGVASLEEAVEVYRRVRAARAGGHRLQQPQHAGSPTLTCCQGMHACVRAFGCCMWSCLQDHM